jgi:chromosome segregation ATPase
VPEVQRLEELRSIVARIEDAAVDGDAGEWLRLSMRRDALPRLITEAKAAPIRAEIARLEAELEDLEEQRKAALREKPEVPPHQRGTVTPMMVRNSKLGGIVARLSAVGRELDERRQELEQIERQGPRDPALVAGRPA